MQEAVARAWLRPPGDIRSLVAWVRTVASNLLRSELRRRGAETRALRRLAPDVAVAELMDPVLERSAVVEALDGLPEGQRRAVVLHYLEDRSVEDVATRLGVTTGTVKRQLYRARAGLAAAVPAPGRTSHSKQGGRRVKSWRLAGSHPNDYEHGIAHGQAHEGRRVVFVRCVVGEPSGFGTLMQMCDADDYLGKRVRFSGSVRSTDVSGWAGLWFRVDGPSGKMLAFDNMQERPIKGTSGWQRHDVVLDVASEASALAYGVLLSGAGEVTVADFRIDVVGNDVSSTDRVTRVPRPENLDFSQD